MRSVHVTSSAKVPDTDTCHALLGALSRTLSEHFDKPEQWVMTALVLLAERAPAEAGSGSP